MPEKIIYYYYHTKKNLTKAQIKRNKTDTTLVHSVAITYQNAHKIEKTLSNDQHLAD